MEGTQDVILTNEAYHERRPAGFWMRFWAYTADLIIVSCINGILLIPFKFINDGAQIDVGFWTVTGILSTIVLYLYFVLMTKFYGQTLGKMIFGLKVVRMEFHACNSVDLFFVGLVGSSLYGMIGMLTLLNVVETLVAKKRGVHAMTGDSIVIHER